MTGVAQGNCGVAASSSTEKGGVEEDDFFDARGIIDTSFHFKNYSNSLSKVALKVHLSPNRTVSISLAHLSLSPKKQWKVVVSACHTNIERC
jgi:hypothetical protein